MNNFVSYIRSAYHPQYDFGSAEVASSVIKGIPRIVQQSLILRLIKGMFTAVRKLLILISQLGKCRSNESRTQARDISLVPDSNTTEIQMFEEILLQNFCANLCWTLTKTKQKQKQSKPNYETPCISSTKIEVQRSSRRTSKDDVQYFFNSVDDLVGDTKGFPWSECLLFGKRYKSHKALVWEK